MEREAGERDEMILHRGEAGERGEMSLEKEGERLERERGVQSREKRGC